MEAHELYHIGIVVEDINQAMQDFTESVGVRWPVESMPDEASMVEVWTSAGTREVPFRAVYSSDGPVRLELVAAVEGTIWHTGSPGDAHHLGYWSDDLEATAAELETKGFERVASGGYLDYPLLWMYHQRGNGPYIEHVSRAVAPMIFGEASWEAS